VPGIDSLTAQMLLTEIGPDLSAFPNVAAFISWLRLLPRQACQRREGAVAPGTGPIKNRAALALRMAARGLHRSQTFLGEYYRRMRARLGAPKANTAAAHMLARIIYHLLTKRQPYDESILSNKRLASANARKRGFEPRLANLAFSWCPSRLSLDDCSLGGGVVELSGRARG